MRKNIIIRFGLLTAGIGLLLLSVARPALPAETISVKKVRDLLEHIGGATFKTEQVQIKKISSGIAGDVIVEASIETAWRLTRSKNDWQVSDVRLGDRHWESMELVEEAVKREKVRRTLLLMEELGNGITAYQKAEKRYVDTDRISELLDAISPRYILAPHRIDLWGNEFEYRGSASSYRLRSAGPDRKSGTPDDLLIEGGVGRGSNR